MKTNLEELNYRARKHLLNNYGYRLFFEAYARLMDNEGFKYDIWVKGLFKDEERHEDESLLLFLEMAFDDHDIYLNDIWDKEYDRCLVSLIDLINIEELVSHYINLAYEQRMNNEIDRANNIKETCI